MKITRLETIVVADGPDFDSDLSGVGLLAIN